MQPVRRKTRWGLWIAVGCLVPVVALATCVGIGVVAYSRQQSEVLPLVRQDIEAVAKPWSADAVWQRFSDKAKQANSQDEVERFVAFLDRHLGPMVSIEDAEMARAFIGTKGRTVTVVARVEFEKAWGTCTIVYAATDDGWKIQKFNVDSPALLSD